MEAKFKNEMERRDMFYIDFEAREPIDDTPVLLC
jgi:hypothetical protein